MKTKKLFLGLGVWFTYMLLPGIYVSLQAQPLPVEIIECQDFFGSVTRGELPSVKACVEKKQAYLYKTNQAGLTPIMVASQLGHLQLVEYLIKQGVSVHSETDNGIQAIHLAAKAGKLDVVKVLVKNGASVNVKTKQGTAPVFYAAWSGNLSLVKFLVTQDAYIYTHGGNGGNLLQWAAMGGNIKMFNYLESKNIDITHVDFDGDGMLHWAAAGTNPDMCRFLTDQRNFSIWQQNYSGRYPINIGIRFHQLATTQYFLANGIDINENDPNGATWLHAASASGSIVISNYLLQKGAEVNTVNSDGVYPLSQAATSGNLELVKLLVNFGAEINPANCLNDGNCINEASPLHGAVWGNAAVVNYLIEKGACLNHPDNKGQTPLHKASSSNCIDCAKVLVDAGADINKQENSGLTPLHLAIKRGNQVMARYLILHHAKYNRVDNKGKTALHYAAIGGYVELIDLMIVHDASVSVADKKGKTPLYYANYYQNTNVAHALVNAGAQHEFKENHNLLQDRIRPGEAVIWYLNHSGFVIKTAHNLLVFDYWQPKVAPDVPNINNGHITAKDMQDKKVTVFVSHDHTDHFDKGIFYWENFVQDITYVFGFEDDIPVEYNYIDNRLTRRVNGMKITTIPSTDSGQGFLVEVDGVTIYHPGDHANGNAMDPHQHNQEIDFLASIANPIDVAFFPVSGCRFSNKTALKQGINYTINKLNPAVAIPMHAANREEEYRHFAREANQSISGHPFIYFTNKGDRYFYTNRQKNAEL